MSVATAIETAEARTDLGSRESCVDLFLISFLILFFELAFIRWFGSNVIFLTFFTNLVLMACFLGMSVGLMSARRGQNLVAWVFPLALLAAGLAVATRAASRVFDLLVDVGGQNSPQQVFFGTAKFTAPNPSEFVVPIEVVAAVFFVLISMTFVGLGQVMGRAFDPIPNRVVAYSVDILGSLTGIVIFGLMSFFRTPPVLWFAISAVILFRFLPRPTWLTSGLRDRSGRRHRLAELSRRVANGDDLVAVLQDLLRRQDRLAHDQQHRPSIDGVGRRVGGGVHAAALAQSRRGRTPRSVVS